MFVQDIEQVEHGGNGLRGSSLITRKRIVAATGKHRGLGLGELEATALQLEGGGSFGPVLQDKLVPRCRVSLSGVGAVVKLDFIAVVTKQSRNVLDSHAQAFARYLYVANIFVKVPLFAVLAQASALTKSDPSVLTGS